MSHFKFGKFEVSIPRLKQNILTLRTERKSSSTGIKTQLISNEFKDILLDYRDTGKFNVNGYQKLPDHDKKLFNDLLQKTGMDDTLGIRIRDDEMIKLIDRYELLSGQVQAGNDSLELRKELKQVVLKLVKLGRLPLKQSYELLLELCLLE